MGNSSYPTEQSAHSDLYDWILKQKYANLSIYSNRDNPSIQIQEYPFFFNDQQTVTREREIYNMRKNHPQLVATMFFTQSKQSDICSSCFKGHVYIERIPIRLSNITDIPYPDILHAYINSLDGFHLLSKQFGYFPVSDDCIGINQQGVVKVWLSQHLQKTYIPNIKVSQHQMVSKIINLLESNTDKEMLPHKQSIKNYIYADNHKVGFQQAKRRAFEYAHKYNTRIWNRLACIDSVGGTQFIAKQVQYPVELYEGLSMIIDNRAGQNTQKQHQKNNAFQIYQPPCHKSQLFQPKSVDNTNFLNYQTSYNENVNNLNMMLNNQDKVIRQQSAPNYQNQFHGNNFINQTLTENQTSRNFLSNQYIPASRSNIQTTAVAQKPININTNSNTLPKNTNINFDYNRNLIQRNVVSQQGISPRSALNSNKQSFQQFSKAISHNKIFPHTPNPTFHHNQNYFNQQFIHQNQQRAHKQQQLLVHQQPFAFQQKPPALQQQQPERKMFIQSPTNVLQEQDLRISPHVVQRPIEGKKSRQIRKKSVEIISANLNKNQKNEDIIKQTKATNKIPEFISQRIRKNSKEMTQQSGEFMKKQNKSAIASFSNSKHQPDQIKEKKQHNLQDINADKEEVKAGQAEINQQTQLDKENEQQQQKQLEKEYEKFNKQTQNAERMYKYYHQKEEQYNQLQGNDLQCEQQSNPAQQFLETAGDKVSNQLPNQQHEQILLQSQGFQKMQIKEQSIVLPKVNKDSQIHKQSEIYKLQGSESSELKQEQISSFQSEKLRQLQTIKRYQQQGYQKFRSEQKKFNQQRSFFENKRKQFQQEQKRRKQQHQQRQRKQKQMHSEIIVHERISGATNSYSSTGGRFRQLTSTISNQHLEPQTMNQYQNEHQSNSMHGQSQLSQNFGRDPIAYHEKGSQKNQNKFVDQQIKQDLISSYNQQNVQRPQNREKEEQQYQNNEFFQCKNELDYNKGSNQHYRQNYQSQSSGKQQQDQQQEGFVQQQQQRLYQGHQQRTNDQYNGNQYNFQQVRNRGQENRNEKQPYGNQQSIQKQQFSHIQDEGIKLAYYQQQFSHHKEQPQKQNIKNRTEEKIIQQIKQSQEFSSNYSGKKLLQDPTPNSNIQKNPTIQREQYYYGADQFKRNLNQYVLGSNQLSSQVSMNQSDKYQPKDYQPKQLSAQLYKQAEVARQEEQKRQLLKAKNQTQINGSDRKQRNQQISSSFIDNESHWQDYTHMNAFDKNIENLDQLSKQNNLFASKHEEPFKNQSQQQSQNLSQQFSTKLTELPGLRGKFQNLKQSTTQGYDDSPGFRGSANQIYKSQVYAKIKADGSQQYPYESNIPSKIQQHQLQQQKQDYTNQYISNFENSNYQHDHTYNEPNQFTYSGNSYFNTDAQYTSSNNYTTDAPYTSSNNYTTDAPYTSSNNYTTDTPYTSSNNYTTDAPYTSSNNYTNNSVYNQQNYSSPGYRSYQLTNNTSSSTNPIVDYTSSTNLMNINLNSTNETTGYTNSTQSNYQIAEYTSSTNPITGYSSSLNQNNQIIDYSNQFFSSNLKKQDQYKVNLDAQLLADLQGLK